jgi:metallophosphoesterase (TIGR00282 family)
MLKILCIGDTYGEPGRRAVVSVVKSMKEKNEVDFVLCNAENTADGSGITEKIARELLAVGCDVLTCGDHVWDHKKEIEDFLNKDNRILRPSNFPKNSPGRGSCVVEARGMMIGVLHTAGQAFMRYHFNSPFLSADEEIPKLQSQGARIILVDFHAEATSEKVAMSWYLDGRVSAVVGSHTHVQTADERVSDKGTACISDMGMTGPYDSVIGANKELILQRFLTQTPIRKQVAVNDVRLCGVLLTVDEKTGRAVSIERIQKKIL